MKKCLNLLICLWAVLLIFSISGCLVPDDLSRFDNPDGIGNISILLPVGLNANQALTSIPLTANYTGQQEVSYQWNKDGAAIAGQTGISLVPDTAGRYSVTISHKDYLSKTSTPVVVNSFVPVTGITGVTNTIKMNEFNTITGTATPASAIFKDIIWELSENNENETAVIENNRLKITENGTVKIIAKVNNGLSWGVDYISGDFEVMNATFVELSVRMEDNDFGLNDEGKVIFEDLEININSINRSEILSLANNNFTNIDWYLGNILLAEDSETYTLEYDKFNLGTHTLTLFFTKDGKRWSGDFTFTVTAN